MLRAIKQYFSRRYKMRTLTVLAGCLLATGGLVAVSLLVAGVRADRAVYGEYWDNTSLARVIVLHARGSTSVEIHRDFGQGPDTVSVIALPMQQIGDVSRVSSLGTGDAKTLIFSGRNSNNAGILCLVEEVGGSFVLNTTYFTETGSDYVGVAFSEAKQQLYVLDCTKKRIQSAPYSPGNPLPTGWTTLLNDQAAPPLADVGEYALTIFPEDDGIEPTLTAYPLNLLGPGDSYSVMDGSTGPSFTIVPGELGKAGHIEEARLFDGQTTVAVSGPPLSSVEIVSVLTGDSVGAGQTDVTGHGNVNVADRLSLGDIYGAKTSLFPTHTAPFLTPTKVWGVPEVLEADRRIQELGPMIALPSWVGNQYYEIPLLIDYSITPTSTVSYPAILMVGTASDVVPIGGGQYVLLGQVSFGTTAVLHPELERGVASVDLPITEPALAGGIICYQWWVTVGTEVKLSNVVGILVRSSVWAPAGSESYFGQVPSSAAKKAPGVQGVRGWTRNRKDQLVQWLVSEGGTVINRSDIARMLKHIQQSKR